MPCARLDRQANRQLYPQLSLGSPRRNCHWSANSGKARKGQRSKSQETCHRSRPSVGRGMPKERTSVEATPDGGRGRAGVTG